MQIPIIQMQVATLKTQLAFIKTEASFIVCIGQRTTLFPMKGKFSLNRKEVFY
jgi:hypothetical protein